MIQVDLPQRSDILILLGDKGGIDCRSLNDVLGFYYHSGNIDLRQYHAGRRFHKLWYYTCLRDRYTKCNMGGETRGICVDAADMAIIPHRFIEAKMAVNDPFARLAVFDVCCSNIPHGPRRRKLMRSGLTDLVAHFRKEDRENRAGGDGPKTEP